MRVAVVGNGPSAPQYAHDIDAHDCVVRINAFPWAQAGLKWDVWASDFYPQVRFQCKRLELLKQAAMPEEIWALGAAKDSYDLLPLKHKFRVSASNGKQRQAMRKYIKARPTSGLITLRMALERKPDEIGLFGFDATTPDATGWGHWWDQDGFCTERTLEVHSFPREKAALREWTETRELCGVAFPDTSPVWWH